MARKPITDFWESTQLGLRLGRWGWAPWLLNAYSKKTPVRLGGVAAKGFHGFSVHPTNCSFRIHCEIAKGCRLTQKQIEKSAHDLGPGILEVDGRSVVVSRGFSSVGEIKGPRPGRKLKPQLKIPNVRRAKLINDLLKWYRGKQNEGWSAWSIVFRRTRRFSAAGLRWWLQSDLVFGRRDGLSWHNYLYISNPSSSKVRQAEMAPYFKQVTASFGLLGFDVDYLGKWGWASTDLSPSSKDILRKASQVAAWRPPKR